MRKTILGGIAVSASLGIVLATGALAGGNGAQRSGLSPQTGNSTTGDQCVAGSGAGTNGFVIVNAPGQPGNARFVNGEVSLKNDSPGNQTYSVWIHDATTGKCVMNTVLTTNNQGNGNAHLNYAGTSGSYYVVLQDSGMNEKYASAEVNAN